jgi:hypothetical protein
MKDSIKVVETNLETYTFLFGIIVVIFVVAWSINKAANYIDSRIHK